MIGAECYAKLNFIATEHPRRHSKSFRSAHCITRWAAPIVIVLVARGKGFLICCHVDFRWPLEGKK